MRTSRFVAAVAVAVLSTACGGGGDAAQTPLAGGSSSAAPEAGATPQVSASAGGTAAGAQVLTGTVGKQGEPDAFVISLTDSSGQKVTTLPAGQYQIQVDDPSDIHNFHLTGAGDVDESTSVEDKEQTTFSVDLQPGDYTVVCDPHPRMKQDFTVT